MSMADEQIVASVDGGRSEGASAQASRRVLDPVDRASEVLFGLIMVLTFTVSLNVAEAGRSDVRAMLVGALGCSLAWGIIDAVMFLMGIKGERGLAARTVRTIREAKNSKAAHEIIAQALPSIVLPALSAADLERIWLHLLHVPDEVAEPRLDRQDYLGALGVFALVFLCTLPVVIPFVFLQDASLALRISNFVAITSLFLTGYTFGKQSGRPWRVGLLMVAIGLSLVSIALVLGG
jgi:VIT1/CCC1 family predicted Fe2+/Mn2+ transporter